MREDLTYLIEYDDTLLNEALRIDKHTEEFKEHVFSEDSGEEMIDTLRKLSMYYRVAQSIAASGRQRCNDMIRKLEGEDR